MPAQTVIRSYSEREGHDEPVAGFFDLDERYRALSFTVSGDTLSVKAPTSNNIATPGFYILFVINKNGTPSQGQVRQMYKATG